MKALLASSFIFMFNFLAVSIQAQALIDQDLTWNSDGFAVSKCRFTLYKADEREVRGKAYIAVVKELAENKGKTTIEDAKFIAEKIAEAQKIEVESILFVHYISSFSFEQAQGRKAILLGTSFRRQENGRLNAPSWRVLSMEDAIAYTDRQFKL